MKFRKKPVVIEAHQFFKDQKPWPKGVMQEESCGFGSTTGKYYVVTIHGQNTYVVDGDWIFPEPDGVHFYPVKNDVVESMYDKVEE